MGKNHDSKPRKPNRYKKGDAVKVQVKGPKGKTRTVKGTVGMALDDGLLIVDISDEVGTSKGFWPHEVEPW